MANYWPHDGKFLAKSTTPLARNASEPAKHLQPHTPDVASHEPAAWSVTAKKEREPNELKERPAAHRRNVLRLIVPRLPCSCGLPACETLRLRGLVPAPLRIHNRGRNVPISFRAEGEESLPSLPWLGPGRFLVAALLEMTMHANSTCN